MNQCTTTTGLEVHHKDTGITEQEGLNEIRNAIVLCKSCHDNRHTNKITPTANPNFSEEVKEEARKRAGGQCQCKEANCHERFNDLRRLIKEGSFKKISPK